MRSCIKSRMKEYKHQFVLFCFLGKEKNIFTIDKRLYNGIDGHSFLVACTRLYKSLCRSVGLSVGRSVGRSVCLSPLCFFGVLRAVFSSPLLPNHTRLMLSCIRDSPLPLPSTLPLLPNTRDFSRFVYPALF